MTGRSQCEISMRSTCYSGWLSGLAADGHATTTIYTVVNDVKIPRLQDLARVRSIYVIFFIQMFVLLVRDAAPLQGLSCVAWPL